jgi:hypothetical protein
MSAGIVSRSTRQQFSHGFIFGYSPGMLYLYWSKELGEKGRAFTIGGLCPNSSTYCHFSRIWLGDGYNRYMLQLGRRRDSLVSFEKGFWCPRLGVWPLLYNFGRRGRVAIADILWLWFDSNRRDHDIDVYEIEEVGMDKLV